MTLVTRTTMWLCAIADDLKQPDRQCIALSALGQKQTCAAQNVMSALRPKADMCGALALLWAKSGLSEQKVRP